jgi:hypothetical protein
MTTQSDFFMTHEQILQAFERLNEELSIAQVHAQLHIVGGAVLCLVHQARPSTRDVDGWFSDASIMRKAAEKVANELRLPLDWLNDGAKGFIPLGARFELYKQWSNLEIMNADIHTLLAMKCAAARGPQDAADIAFLAKKLDLFTADEVLNVVTQFYPASQIPMRTQLLLEEIFDA